MPPLIALLDANVLYPAELRSFLMYLALTGIYRAKWSHDIHEEWITSLLLNRPDLTRAQLERTRTLMDQHAHDALVTGYQRLIPRLSLPDLQDRHVLAAAIKSKANVLVTNNLKDFPCDTLQQFGITPQTPDAFVSRLYDISAESIVEAAEDHRLSLKNLPKSISEYLDTLEAQGLAQSVSKLRAALL